MKTPLPLTKSFFTLTAAVFSVASAFGQAAPTKQVATTHLETKMVALMEGKPAGTASFSISDDGKKIMRQMLVHLTLSGQKLEFEIDTSFDQLGNPLVASYKGTANGKPFDIETTFDANGAHCVATGEGGFAQKKDVPLQKPLSMKNPVVLWFLKSKPEKGQKVGFETFDSATGNWAEESVEYVGQEALTLDSGVVQAQHLKVETDGVASNMFLDDRGLVVSFDFGNGLLIQKSN